ncbi:DUF3742 family protein [Pseudomonas juntendi]|uniref:DUF3742 family protein n=1 Tax=Pseudomonas juntendi TaxID=2666183 RepID=UPI001F204652|nr:DUF3742 family protein [Pseudomonas juntendi]MCO7054934.1 DUF3742 family protein [Pseudomonas juntendi]UJM14698.1 DUF3742 family protein [Pseudomonas juntendi]
MTAPASSSTSHTPFGKFLIRAAGRAGRLVNQLEASVMHSSILASVPFGYRRLGMQTVKLILLLAVASVAFFLAIGMVALWAFAALPIATHDDDEEPGVHQVSHPQHQHKYPELYDEHGSLR